MRLKVGSRKSDLARWQAKLVADRLGTHTEFLFKSSFGDQNLDIPLAGMGARGVFTEDFRDDLIEGRCDLVVHSWKDLPIDEREATRIIMTLPRADVRDLILIPEDVWFEATKTGKLAVLTSSPRRVYNLRECLPKLLPGNLTIEFHPVRGNVPTRLRKMRNEKAALVLAKAGLDRLLEAEQQNFLDESVRALIQSCRFQILPVSLNPPAPAQGALAVEIKRDREDLIALCARENDPDTFASVHAEREILKKYGGGCHQKIGVARMPRDHGTVCSLRGLTDDGRELREWRIENDTPWTKAALDENVFPRQPKDNSWFERARVLADLKDRAALFVARAEAWPEDLKFDRLVWTAGVKTWIRLAAQGIFVSGCQDGLGEHEPMHLQNLVGEPLWTKISHTRTPTTVMPVVPTYELIEKSQVPDLTQATHFFWMSSTAFESAWKRFPEQIAKGYNACGPGHTYDYLKRKKELQNPVKVFIDLEQFLAESLP